MIEAVTMKLICDLYNYTLKSDMGIIPLHTNEWYSAFDGLGPVGSGKYDFKCVRNKARELFPNYKFHLYESDTDSHFKFYLKYEKIS